MLFLSYYKGYKQDGAGCVRKSGLIILYSE